MTDSELANELQAISLEIDDILANERSAGIGAIEELLQSVQEVKAAGGWRNTRFNVFDVLGRAATQLWSAQDASAAKSSMTVEPERPIAVPAPRRRRLRPAIDPYSA
jgi:uncharacterized protein HemX